MIQSRRHSVKQTGWLNLLQVSPSVRKRHRALVSVHHQHSEHRNRRLCSRVTSSPMQLTECHFGFAQLDTHICIPTPTVAGIHTHTQHCHVQTEWCRAALARPGVVFSLHRCGCRLKRLVSPALWFPAQLVHMSFDGMPPSTGNSWAWEHTS